MIFFKNYPLNQFKSIFTRKRTFDFKEMYTKGNEYKGPFIKFFTCWESLDIEAIIWYKLIINKSRPKRAIARRVWKKENEKIGWAFQKFNTGL